MGINSLWKQPHKLLPLVQIINFLAMPGTAKVATRTKKTLSKQAQFTNNKLIQNLGSNSEQYNFKGYLRTAYGRD